MSSKTNEAALESAIEKRLTGTCLEDLRAQGITRRRNRAGGAVPGGQWLLHRPAVGFQC